MKNFWNDRFSTQEYAYGEEPNEFLKIEISKISQAGKILLLGEGEGRNANYAAQLGWTVDAVDWSEEGKRKAEILARKNNLIFNYSVFDLRQYTPQIGLYDVVGLIFLHFEEEIREQIHKKAIESLRVGGKIILEAYDKSQIGKSSGGPQELDLLYSLEDIVNDFSELEFEEFSQETVYLNEGKFHIGDASVIRFVGTKK